MFEKISYKDNNALVAIIGFLIINMVLTCFMYFILNKDDSVANEDRVFANLSQNTEGVGLKVITYVMGIYIGSPMSNIYPVNTLGFVTYFLILLAKYIFFLGTGSIVLNSIMDHLPEGIKYAKAVKEKFGPASELVDNFHSAMHKLNKIIPQLEEQLSAKAAAAAG